MTASSNSKRASDGARKGDMGSPDVLRVLIIDDERLSAHNLGIQLKFVGETPYISTSETWLRAVASSGGQE